MGAGSYWAVVYGCPDYRADGNGEKLDADDKLADRFDAMLDELSIQTSYEGSSPYAGIMLLHTLTAGRDYDSYIPGGVMPIDELPKAIRKAIDLTDLARAQESWEQARQQAAEMGLTLSAGELLWLGDYE